MRLLVLLLVGIVGTLVAAWGLPRGGRPARAAALVGIAALGGLTAGALALHVGRVTDTGQPIGGLFDGHLVGTMYLRLALALWGLQSLLLVGAAWLLGGLPRLVGLLPATLAAMTGGAVAMSSADLAVGAAAAAGTGLASLLVILRGEGAAAVAAGARELRVALVTGTVLIVAMAVVPLAARLALIAAGVGTDDETEAVVNVAGPAMGLVMLAMGLALAARWGMLPFHVRVSRLTDLVPSETLPVLVAWGALPLTVVAFAAVDRLVAPLALPLDGERAVLVGMALVTLAGAALAASVHDDLRHAVGYLVVADAGLLLLALAALDPIAWGPGREWVIALAASKTALAAWAAVVEDRFESRSIPDLRGWMRRSPLLAASLALTVVATYGLPGWLALDARAALADGAWGSPWREVLLAAGFLTLPAYLRLVRLGVGRVTSRVDRAAPERILRRRRTLEALVVEQESGPADAGTEPAGSLTVPGSAGPAADPGGTPGGLVAIARGAVSGARGAAGRARATGAAAAAARIGDALRRDRTELLSGAVLALAILAALTSWGALDLADAASEPAPIILSGATD